MKIAVTSFLDQLYDLQVQGALIVTLYQNKEISFIDDFLAWLVQAETVLKNNHRSQISEIAGIRAQLLAASRNVYDRSVVSIPMTAGPKKNFHAFAAILFNHAQGILSRQHDVFVEMKTEAEKYVRQILLISLQKKTFYPIWTSQLSASEKLINLWASFLNDADLVQGTRQVLISVNYADALRILDEVISDLKL
jgi:hypothetical protein